MVVFPRRALPNVEPPHYFRPPPHPNPTYHLPPPLESCQTSAPIPACTPAYTCLPLTFSPAHASLLHALITFLLFPPVLQPITSTHPSSHSPAYTSPLTRHLTLTCTFLSLPRALSSTLPLSSLTTCSIFPYTSPPTYTHSHLHVIYPYRLHSFIYSSHLHWTLTPTSSYM
jgi:hypothetical protein